MSAKILNSICLTVLIILFSVDTLAARDFEDTCSKLTRESGLESVFGGDERLSRVLQIPAAHSYVEHECTRVNENDLLPILEPLIIDNKLNSQNLNIFIRENRFNFTEDQIYFLQYLEKKIKSFEVYAAEYGPMFDVREEFNKVLLAEIKYIKYLKKYDNIRAYILESYVNPDDLWFELQNTFGFIEEMIHHFHGHLRIYFYYRNKKENNFFPDSILLYFLECMEYSVRSDFSNFETGNVNLWYKIVYRNHKEELDNAKIESHSSQEHSLKEMIKVVGEFFAEKKKRLEQRISEEHKKTSK